LVFHFIAGVSVIVFNTTVNNISGIPWESVFLVEEIGVPGENHRPATTFYSPIQFSRHIVTGSLR